jgi:uncharacterized membrane protein YhaH (DUF805 family)
LPNQFLWLFFGFSGRVSRAAYFLAGLLLAIIQAFFLYRTVVAQDAGFDTSPWESAFVITFFASLWSNVALGVKRLHDIDKTGHHRGGTLHSGRLHRRLRHTLPVSRHARS